MTRRGARAPLPSAIWRADRGPKQRSASICAASSPHDISEQVVADLRDRSLINDDEFARLWTESRLRSKPRSAWLVKRELMNKGVSGDLAEAAVSECDDTENAYRAASSYSRRLDGADYETFHRRLYGYMTRRGFSGSTSRSVISSLWRAREEGAGRR